MTADLVLSLSACFLRPLRGRIFWRAEVILPRPSRRSNGAQQHICFRLLIILYDLPCYFYTRGQDSAQLVERVLHVVIQTILIYF